jgi:hypothetical protein
MQVKGCTDYVTVSSVATTTYTYSVPTSPAGSSTTIISGGSYFSTTDSSNCAMTISLHLASNDATYSGSFLSLASDGTLTVNTNVHDTQTVYIKIQAGINNAFSQVTSNLAITTNCDLGYTITAGSATTTQSVQSDSSSVGFTLPSYTSSNTACPVTRTVSSSGSSFSSMSALNAPA